MRPNSKEESALVEQADELFACSLELSRWMLGRKPSLPLYPELAGKISRGQLHALILLAEGREEPCIGRLAAMLNLDESTVTRLVDKLEATGVAVRRRSSDDRRSTTVALTETGRRIVAVAREHQRDFLIEVLKALEPAERSEFVRLMAKAAEALRRRSDGVLAK